MARNELGIIPLLLISISVAAAEPAKAPPNTAAIDAIRRDVDAARKRLAELDARRVVLVSTAKRKAPYTRSAITHLVKYTALLRARYIDEEGEFVSGIELLDVDRQNVGNLLQTYLQEALPPGRLSAGRANEALEHGRKRLKELADAQENPSYKNNSELEIVETRSLVEEEFVSDRIQAAKDLGYKL